VIDLAAYETEAQAATSRSKMVSANAN
jgi:hypothetical protein